MANRKLAAAVAAATALSIPSSQRGANDLAAVAPQLLAQGMMALRSMNFMPALVNNDFDAAFAEKGTVVTVPIPSAVVAQDVAPANVPPATADSAPTSVPVTLDQWKEAPFYMTDKDLQASVDGVIPMQASEAIKALADAVNGFIFSKYKGFYGYAGTAGTTPFQTDTTAATEVRKVLNNQLAPLGDRRMMLNADAEANALNLRAFQDTSWSNSPAAIQEGQITRKLGFDWFSDQQVPFHTTGAAGTFLVDNVAGYAVGATALHFDGATVTPSVGDIFTIAGDLQTYVVLTASVLTGTDGDITFAPGLKVAAANDTAMTFKASHAVNLAFHRDAIAFASRPMADIAGLGNIIQVAVDPVSGISLRLEISREHKRTRFSYDLLYGAGIVRREFGARLAG